MLQKDRDGFVELSKLLKQRAGINLPLTEKNLSLMAGRLNSTLQRRNIDGYASYLDLLKHGPPELTEEFISCLTTNTTEFFRENPHFDVLTQLLPDLMASKNSGSRELRVWCAASSTGQEPYSLLMTLLLKLGESAEHSLRMLATDIDLEVLKRAAEGRYKPEELRQISEPLRKRFFSHGGGATEYQVQERYRRLIRFAQFNLIQDRYPFKYPFDIVFCRNVLIYFDSATTHAVIERMAEALAPGGYLFIGHAEGGMMRLPALERISHSVYRKRKG